MIRIGLTGSIGMGKSTTAALFQSRGAPVHDSDAAVARLYAQGGSGVPVVAEITPGAIRDGAVDRSLLRAEVLNNPEALKRLEAAIHPLVAEDRRAFVDRVAAEGGEMVVLDIPLLFETGSEALCDVVVVVSAPAAVQRARVLARPGMTEAALERILKLQTPDAEKRARADYVIDSSVSIEDADRQVAEVLTHLKTRLAGA